MPTLNEVIKEYEKLTELLNKQYVNRKNKEVGIYPRCTVCNSPQLDNIEKMREDGATYTEIINELNLNMSIMSLSRHFKNHYPKRTRYKLKRKKLMLKKVIEIIKKYPFLEPYFNNKDYDEIKEFTEVKGFCIDCFKLCELIPANKVSDSQHLQAYYTEKIKQDLNNNYGYNSRIDETTIKNILLKENCLTCNNKLLNERLNINDKLLAILLNNENIEPKELYYIYKTKYNNDLNLFTKEILKR